MKTLTLFKRSDQRDAPYYFKFEFRDRAYTRCLETPDATLAQQRARLKYAEIKDAVIKGEYDRLDATKTRHTVHATLGELIAAYQASPVRASAKTRKSNVRALLNLLRQVFPSPGGEGQGEGGQIMRTPFPKLVNGDTAEAWFKLEGIEPQTANSLWRQAASLCAPRAQFTYKKLKIWHKCLDDFASTGTVCQRTVSKAPPRPPSDDIIAATIKAWETLEDHNLFLAIGHELAFGLRAGEVAQARWDWWTVKYGSPMLCATGNFKHNHEGYFELPALDPYYTTMRQRALSRDWYVPSPAGAGEGGRRPGEGCGDNSGGSNFIITGSPSYRTDGLPREVSAFMRSLGWATQKTNHALRAYAGGQVALKYGIYKAKEFLRHSSVKVTEQHYMYLLKNVLIDTIREACPAKWATLEPSAPILTIVPQPQTA